MTLASMYISSKKSKLVLDCKFFLCTTGTTYTRYLAYTYMLYTIGKPHAWSLVLIGNAGTGIRCTTDVLPYSYAVVMRFLTYRIVFYRQVL